MVTSEIMLARLSLRRRNRDDRQYPPFFTPGVIPTTDQELEQGSGKVRFNQAEDVPVLRGQKGSRFHSQYVFEDGSIWNETADTQELADRNLVAGLARIMTLYIGKHVEGVPDSIGQEMNYYFTRISS